MQIKRAALLRRLKTSAKRSRVTALIGPRQCGKTTLARQLANPGSVNYFDEVYYQGTHGGAELDLLLVKNGSCWELNASARTRRA